MRDDEDLVRVWARGRVRVRVRVRIRVRVRVRVRLHHETCMGETSYEKTAAGSDSPGQGLG